MHSFRSFLLSAACLLLTAACLAQEGPLDPSPPKRITTDEIIQRFAAKEKEFKIARDAYTYRQSYTVQSFDGGTVDGEFQQVVDILFDDKGRRVESVVFAPQPTLKHFSMSPEDFDDLEHRLPFVLTSDEIGDYNISYLGQQPEDELHTYVFDVSPKTIEKNRRYFEGRIWVDDQDFQIVKTYGKNVPDIRKKNNENLFPAFTTYREQIDGRYWFPTYTRADDTLHFKNEDAQIRMVVRYENYKRFGTRTRITFQGQELPKGEEQKKDQPQPPQQPPK